jgi:hypothetical protein
MGLRSPIRSFLTSVVLLIGLAALGCAGGPLLSGDDEAARVLDRLRERRDAIQTATYRVRWRSVGVEPHAEFILEIAYRAPEQYRIVATGPFGLPAFTAVVIGDDFTFVNHRDGRFITDELANLIDYEFPVAEFFEGPWRDLFGGGWGGSHEVDHLTRVGESDRFTAQSEGTDWTIKWNRGKNGPASVAARAENDDGVLVADVWFDDFHRDRPPFWKLDRLVLRGVADGGEHRWKLLKQDYNIPIPERFFTPLQPPPEWERPRN